MPKAKLRKYVEEPVTLMVQGVDPADVYGEQNADYTAGATLLANVQPLGAELAATLNLTTTNERLRVQLPVVLLDPLDRMTLRGHTWRVLSSEQWQSYTVVVVEKVQP